MRRVAFVLAVLCAGCATRVAYGPPPEAAPVAPVVLEASFDETWQAVVQTFFDRNLPVRTVEKASGLLESDDLRGEIGRDCDCGRYLGVPIGGYGGAYGGDAAFRYRVLVERRGDGSTLTLRSTCRARIDTVEGELVCRLDPARETALRDAIVSRASASATPAP